MSITTDTRTEFSIGPWRVYPQLGQLECDGNVQHLEPKVMQVLVTLAAQPGEVISKQQLIEHVWQGRTVGDEVITRSISLLRSSLGDNPKTPTYIETLPKLGYRLLPDPTALTLAESEPAAIQHSSDNHRWQLWILAGLILVGLLVAANHLYMDNKNDQPITHITSSVAVLPFVNMSGPEQQYLCEGISEQIISALGALPKVDVAARTSSFRFRNSELDIRDIAAQLGVTAIVEGSVRRSGQTLRVSAQMVDAATGYQHWSDSFDGNIEDVFELQERVSSALAKAILSNSSDYVPPSTPTPPVSFAAYDAYLRAQYALNRRTYDDLNRAIELYKESIALDERYAPSYQGLAYSYLLLPSYSQEEVDVNYDQALAIIDQGASINPVTEQMGASVRAFINFKRGRWIAAHAAFEKALNNAYIEPTTYQWYSQMLASVGQLERSLEMAQRGREADPLSPVANSRLAIAHLWMDQNEQARQFFDIANSLGLTTSVHLESYILLLLREGRYDEANQLAAQIQHALGTRSVEFEQAMQAISQPEARALAIKNVQTAMARHDISPRVGVLLWALLDAPDRAAGAALELIERGDLFEYELLFISELEAVRASPAFKQIVAQLDLPDYWQSAGCVWKTGILRCVDAESAKN